MRHVIAVVILLALPACGGSKPPQTPDLASVTLTSNTVTAGQQVQGTVALTIAAGSGSVTVNLSSSSTAVATVPASVGVAQGSTTSTFTVNGVSAGTVNINASLGATTRQATLTVNAAAGPTANFRVLQGNGNSGVDTNFTCPVDRDNSTGTLRNLLNCTFDGTLSTAPGGITAYNWTIFNAVNQPAATPTGSTLVMPTVPCGSFDGVTTRNVTLSITPSGANSTATKSVTLQKANPC
jgi:hypothetical protein